MDNKRHPKALEAFEKIWQEGLAIDRWKGFENLKEEMYDWFVSGWIISNQDGRNESESLGAHLRNLLTPYNTLLCLIRRGNANEESISRFHLDNLDDLVAFSNSDIMEQTKWGKPMKVFGCEAQGAGTGGLILVAATSVDEAFDIATKSKEIGYLFYSVSDYTNEMSSSLYPRNKWHEFEHLRCDFTEPQMILENSHEE